MPEVRVFTNTASGKLARRPQLDAMLDYVRPGDVVVITKLDRLGRSAANTPGFSAALPDPAAADGSPRWAEQADYPRSADGTAPWAAVAEPAAVPPEVEPVTERVG